MCIRDSYRGAITEFGDFIPNAFAYFLVVLHCRTKLRLQILVLLLFFVSVFVIVNGAVELQTITPFSFNHPQSDVDDLQFTDAGPDIQAADTNAANTYLMPQLGADGIISVSYTHLDVYKRQRQDARSPRSR